MRPIDPSDLATSLAITRHKSFRRAADEIGCTPSALSHAMRALEERLDVRLPNRTTRSVALTEAGEQLHARVAPAFRGIDDALDDLNNFRGTPTGNPRINAARSSAQIVLLPMVTRFLAAHAGISVEIVVDNTLVDMVSEGFGAGVRFGEVVAQDMIAVPLAHASARRSSRRPLSSSVAASPRHPSSSRICPVFAFDSAAGAIMPGVRAQRDRAYGRGGWATDRR